MDEAGAVEARHRRELKDLQGRMTSKKKNANKKTRKGVNDECAQMERELREKQAAEIATVRGGQPTAQLDEEESEEETHQKGLAKTTSKVEANIEGKLQKAPEKLHVSPSPSGGDREPESTGKKRNRQKERLARRAAEQEAAAQRAEDEASTMTDHRARESEYMKKMFENYELTEEEIEPDGHCLFSAVADQLRQNGIPLVGAASGQQEPAYKTVRRAATVYMAENEDDFAPFLDEELGPYLVKMRDTAEWGGELELMALARRFGVEIRVVQDGRMEKIGEEVGEATGKTLWLAYYRHGYGLGEHYNSLRKARTKV